MGEGVVVDFAMKCYRNYGGVGVVSGDTFM